MKAIHLIQNDPALRPWPINKGSSTYKSGFWEIAIDRAAESIGADIYFHDRQIGLSFFGGKILSVEIETNGPWRGRAIFTFEASRTHKGIKTGREGWSVEMKIVN